jgi:hypothetical protein
MVCTIETDYFQHELRAEADETSTKVGERRDSWHTFHVIIFHIFPVHVKLNLAARMVSNTLGLQSDLHKFDAIRKE